MRVIAEYAYNLTSYEIVGEFIKAGAVGSEEEFTQMISEVDEAAAEFGNKGQKAELGLRYLDAEKPKKLLSVASALVNESFRKIRAGKEEVEKLNRFLVHDGYLYDPKAEAIVPNVGEPKMEKELSSELDRRLNTLDPRFVRMHAGIWDALASGSDDAARQSISSSRELLRQAIDRLAGKSAKDLERRAKIRLVLESGKNVEIVESVGRLANSIYGSGSAGEHTSTDSGTAVLLGRMTEYCLLYILRSAQGKS